MLSDNAAVATVAVKDLAAARPFYEKTLGLECVGENSEVLTFKAGGQRLFVYRSSFAGTNEATSVTWPVKDIDAIVPDLKAKGVAFEDYGDMPHMTHDGDIYRAEGMAVTWFKDPDGNIHSLVSGEG